MTIHNTPFLWRRTIPPRVAAQRTSNSAILFDETGIQDSERVDLVYTDVLYGPGPTPMGGKV